MLDTRTYSSAPTPRLQYLNAFKEAAKLWRHRSLIKQFTIREVMGRYKGSHLGFLWSFLNPLVMLTIYTFVFGSILKVKWSESGGTLEFALTLFCGLIFFNLFSECMVRAPGLVIGNPNFVKKVVFPLEILPITALGGALVHATISLSILLVTLAIVSGTVHVTLLLVPVMLIPLLMLCLGIGWLLSALGVFLRDMGYVVGIALQIFSFMTPIFFPITAVPEQYRWIMNLNPLSSIIESERGVVLWGLMPHWGLFARNMVLSFIFMQLGFLFFMRSKRAFSDVI